jgi:pyrimidine operon attenuation protein / uracil phosphoribosyltransferase
MTETKTLLLDKLQIEQKINRLAYQVYEDCADENGIIIAGIAPNGFKLAERLAGRLQEISPLDTRLVKVAVSDKENPMNSCVTR